jgi:Hint domain
MPSNFSGTTGSGVNYSFVYNPGVLGGTLGATYNMTITDPDGTVTTVNGIPFANVDTAASGGTISIASLLIGGNFVVPPGVTGTVNVTVALATLFPNTVYVGGNATISTTVSGLSGLTVDVDGGTATAAGGALLGALSGMTVNLDNGGTFSNGSALISALNGTTINFAATGGTFIANAGGALLNLSSTTINGFDAAKDTIEFQNLSAALDHYTVTTSGSSQTIELFDNNNNEIGSVTVAGTAFTTGSFSAVGNGPLTVTQAGTTISVVPVPSTCFLAGTMIRTPKGEVAVEEIRVGDRVVVHDSDAPRDVIWVGSKHVNVRPGPALDDAGCPVCVLKDAIAEGVPFKDLLITPEHSLFFDGKLVPVRMLVNGRSIFYDTAIQSYDYYHIETSAHSVIYADGMPTESYLDTGNRRSFAQSSGVVNAFGCLKTWKEDAAAPLTVAREQVEPLFRQVEARAEALGFVSKATAPELITEADLHLVTDTGRVLRKARDADGQALFMIPAGVTSVRVASRTCRPSDVVGPFVDDRRRLGVLVGEITLRVADAVRKVDVHLTTPGLSGWDVVEAAPCRWTNGFALLPLGERKASAICMLGLTILAAGPYIAEKSRTEKSRLSA